MELPVPPNINCRHVTAYNSHGKALVELLESTKISSLHHPFIVGLFAIYNKLIFLKYMNSDDVSWAPHLNYVSEE
jgi:hypothetical protein